MNVETRCHELLENMQIIPKERAILILLIKILVQLEVLNDKNTAIS